MVNNIRSERTFSMPARIVTFACPGSSGLNPP
jgi:hypothetical protein